eukprot:m.286368 g.286368  ORF g.286368 m.286368 type:complete len:942 (+) comp40691_c0_seq78:361-3186(+)
MEHNFQVCYYDNRALTGTSKISAPIFYTFRPGIPIAKDLAIVKERLDCPQNVEGLSLEIEQGGPNLDLNATIEEQVAEWNLIPTDRTTVLCLCTKPSLVVPIYLEELRSGLRQGSWEALPNLLSLLQRKQDGSLVEEFVEADGLDCLLNFGRTERQRSITLEVISTIFECYSRRMKKLHLSSELLRWLYSEVKAENTDGQSVQALDLLLLSFTVSDTVTYFSSHLTFAIHEEDESNGRKPWMLLKKYMEVSASLENYGNLHTSLDFINSVFAGLAGWADLAGLAGLAGTRTFSDVLCWFKHIGMDTLIEKTQFEAETKNNILGMLKSGKEEEKSVVLKEFQSLLSSGDSKAVYHKWGSEGGQAKDYAEPNMERSSEAASVVDYPLTPPEREVILVEFQGMVLKFRKMEMLEKNVGPRGAKIRSEFSSLTIPEEAFCEERESVHLGFTVYAFDEEESEGVLEDTVVTDLLVFHPCGESFTKDVTVNLSHDGLLWRGAPVALLYEPQQEGSFDATWIPYGSEAYSAVRGCPGMNANVDPNSIEVNMRHFCKFFACLFHCKGHKFRILAYGRSLKMASKTIDIHFTSCRSRHVEVVKSCYKGLSMIAEDNVFLYFSRGTRNKLNAVLNAVHDSPGWIQTGEKALENPLDERELKKAKRVPGQFCTRTLMLEKIKTDAVEDLQIGIHITGEKTNCWFTLVIPADTFLSVAAAEGLLQREVNALEIAKLSKLICSDWNDVARLLNPLSSKQITTISKFYDGDLVTQAENMLEHWTGYHGRQATVLSLCCALLDLNLTSPIERVFGKDIIEVLRRKEIKAKGSKEQSSLFPRQVLSILDKKISEGHLRKVHLKIKEFWRRVARFLGGMPLSDIEIDSCGSSHQAKEDQCYEMLRKWMIKQEGKGTVYQLCAAIIEAELGDVVEEAFGADVLRECRERNEKQQTGLQC